MREPQIAIAIHSMKAAQICTRQIGRKMNYVRRENEKAKTFNPMHCVPELRMVPALTSPAEFDEKRELEQWLTYPLSNFELNSSAEEVLEDLLGLTWAL